MPLREENKSDEENKIEKKLKRNLYLPKSLSPKKNTYEGFFK